MLFKSKSHSLRQVASRAIVPALFACISSLDSSAAAFPTMQNPTSPTVVETVVETVIEPSDNNNDEVYVAVDKAATFPGGQNELMKFLAKNIQYPESAQENDVQGRVIVKFIVTKTGKIENPIVIKGVSPDLDAEAIRVVKEMPNWIPGEINYIPVSSYFNLPITFRLQRANTKDSTK